MNANAFAANYKIKIEGTACFISDSAELDSQCTVANIIKHNTMKRHTLVM